MARISTSQLAPLLDGAREFARSRRPDRRSLKKDAVAGLPVAIGAVPDGLATATLVGVNPVFGLYAAMTGQIVGGLSASTRMMVVTTTTAASLAAGSALASTPAPQRPGALVVLTMLAGAIMLVAGLLRCGRFIRFVSRSVMLGFLTGVGVNITLGQLPNLVGARPEGDTAVVKAFHTLASPDSWNRATTVIGVCTLGLLVLLSRTRLANVGPLVAVLVPSVLVALSGLDTVGIVSDVGAIPAGLPELAMPHLSDLSSSVILGAAAVAAIVLIQGAGVAQSAPNAAGRPATTNGDFIAQGVANLAVGLVRGIPVGGSVSSTALNLMSGARSRWASICAGLWVLVILVCLSTLIGYVVSSTLAAILMFVGFRSLAFREIGLAWRTGSTAQVAMTVTFLSTLALPIAAAVGIGIIVSLMLQLNRESLDLTVVELTKREDGRTVERRPPRQLADRQLVVLEVYGSLLYAGSRTLQHHLPEPAGAREPVVVLRLRGHSTLGATFFSVIAAYSDLLATSGGRLYLSGVAPEIVARFRQVLAPDSRNDIRVFEATEVIGESTLEAVEHGRTWLVGRDSDGPPEGGAAESPTG